MLMLLIKPCSTLQWNKESLLIILVVFLILIGWDYGKKRVGRQKPNRKKETYRMVV